METIEGNILIAKFMQIYDENKSGEKYTTGDALKYHTSWDWLMPVVEKIYSVGYKMIISYANGTVRIIDNNADYDEWIDFDSENIPVIEAVWKSVIQFIQWYNTTLNK